MKNKLYKKNRHLSGSLRIVSSKSESNRALIIQALCGSKSRLFNLSGSSDTQILINSIEKFNNNISPENELLIDIKDCGTAMRFLTAFLAVQNGNFLLTGSDRMLKRPVGLLVDALNSIGADISYVSENGFPPLLIKPGNIRHNAVSLSGSVSSQFISALLMIAPVLPFGLKISLEGRILSLPYINMTLKIMSHFGIKYSFIGNIISINPQKYLPEPFTVGGDWTAASYWYELAAFSDSADIEISDLINNGLQGDEKVLEMFEGLGVQTSFIPGGIKLIHKSGNRNPPSKFDFTGNPDLAQTLAVTCAGLNLPCSLTGLDNLSVKETNRVEALRAELSRLGFNIIAPDNRNLLINEITDFSKIVNRKPEIVNTYGDHRMALSFAPLALIFNEIIIENPQVVTKSYPDFWQHLKSFGFQSEEID